jgi:hypothetical protein
MLPREIDNDGPAAVRFLRDFHRARVGSVFGGVAGLMNTAATREFRATKLFLTPVI